MVHETDIVEFELKSKRFNLSVKKKEALKAQEVQVKQRGRGDGPGELPTSELGSLPATRPNRPNNLA